MTQDEIIEMARQAGASKFITSTGVQDALTTTERVVAFAKMCFEKGRQQGIKQEHALWKLAETSRDIGWDK